MGSGGGKWKMDKMRKLEIWSCEGDVMGGGLQYVSRVNFARTWKCRQDEQQRNAKLKYSEQSEKPAAYVLTGRSEIGIGNKQAQNVQNSGPL